MKKAWLVVALVAGCGERTRAPVQADPLPAPAKDPIRHKPEADNGYLGVLTPDVTTQVTSPYTTTIAKLDVKLGDPVTKGQVMARFDDRPVKQQLAIEQATLHERQAQAGRAAVTVSAMRTELNRAKEALEAKVGSVSEVDAARAKLDQAGHDLEATSAGVEQQRATIAKLQAKLNELALVAPFDGSVAFVYAREGERVDEGRPVIRVDAVGKLVVRFAIPADKFGSLKEGDGIDLAVENVSSRLRAVVRGVQPNVDAVAKMQLADAVLDGAPAELHSGARCRVFPKKQP